MPTKRIKREQVSTWNLNKVDGWKAFKELQSKVKEKTDNIIADQTLTIYEVDKKVDNIQTKIKFQLFGKTKPMTENAKKHRMEKRHKPSHGMEDEEELKTSISKRQNELIEDAINAIKSKGFGRQINVFKMKEIVAGSKKQKQEAHAVVDPKTGETVVSVKEIKRVNLEHCIAVLKHNKPSEDVEKLMKFEEEMHNKVMEDKTDFNTSITKDQFEDILKKFKERNKRSYDFITKAGEDFQDSMFMLYKRMIGEECFPTRFEKTTLYNLWKRKGGFK